jgi:hypothetical protein
MYPEWLTMFDPNAPACGLSKKEINLANQRGGVGLKLPDPSVSCKEKRIVRNIMDQTNFTKLRVYILSEELADYIWEIVKTWDKLAQFTVGEQIIDAADSVGANTCPVK